MGILYFIPWEESFAQLLGWSKLNAHLAISFEQVIQAQEGAGDVTKGERFLSMCGKMFRRPPARRSDGPMLLTINITSISTS